MDIILEKIKRFAANAHGSQLRKYTGEPYINHPERVMQVCREYSDSRPLLAAALLHDVLEDTEVTGDELGQFLMETMDRMEAVKTLKLVVDLTDVYVKENYPSLNRKTRKSKEAERLVDIDPDAQTVKYSDIIDNAVDITRYDQHFARKYLREIMDFLRRMDKGHPDLYHRALETVRECRKKLGKIS